MPKGFTEHEKELIGERLLEQGYRLFSVYGLRKTNVGEIAEAAGISKGSFYSFYESKEALFLAVIEQAERRIRQEIMTAIDLPGPSPRARLFTVLKKAFAIFGEAPFLRLFTGADFDLLFRRLPQEKLQMHLINDQAFMRDLVGHCREAGIPIQAQPEQIFGLLYPVVLTMMHKDDLGEYSFSESFDLQLELVAAFCLGEIDIRLQKPVELEPDP